MELIEMTQIELEGLLVKDNEETTTLDLAMDREDIFSQIQASSIVPLCHRPQSREKSLSA